MQNTWYEWMIDHPWAIELILVIALLFFLNVVLKKILARSKKMAKLGGSDWCFHLDYVVVTPAHVLLWVLLISFILDLGIREFHFGSSLCYVAPFRNAAIIFCLAWFLLRWKKVFHTVISSRLDRRRQGHFSMDPLTIEVIGKLFTIAVVFIALLIIMQMFGLNILPLIAFGGIGAATLGIAGKDMISNFFGGFMIYLTRPFMVGDVIELSQRKILGHVEEIGWYLTSVRDMKKQPIYIPNSVFSSEPLINQSRMTHRRIEESIGVSYRDLEKIPSMVEAIRGFFKQQVSIDHQLPICVFLERFEEGSIRIEIKVYILCTRYEEFMEIRQGILSEIYGIIERAGAQILFPTMHVKIYQ